MSKMSQLHAVQNDRPEIHDDDFDCDWNAPTTGHIHPPAEWDKLNEPDATPQPTPDRRNYDAPYVRVYLPTNLTQPTPPEGYKVTRAALRTDGRIGQLDSEGDTLEQVAERMAEHLDGRLILSIEAENTDDDGTHTLYSEWRTTKHGANWSEWQTL